VALARRQPLILIFEDLHWADDLSLQLLTLLLEAIPTTPLLLLYIYRPEPHHPSQRLARLAAQKFPRHFTELHLRELSAAESQSLAKSLLGVTSLPLGLDTLLLEKAQGNPFFLEEALRSLVDAGAIYWIEEGWQARPEIETVAVPESVQSIILSRLDHLASELQQLLQHAAVMGRLFLPSVIAQTLPAGFNLEQGLLALEEAAMIYQERVVPEVEYSFKHTLTQETIYQTLSRQRRSSLHQQVAQAIEQLYADNLRTYDEQLAYHYYHSEAGEKAIEYMIKAGQKSAAAYFNEEAIHYFQKASDRLETLSPASPEAEMQQYRWQLAALTGLGQIYHGMGHDREAEQYLQQAITIGRQAKIPAKEMVRSYHWLSEVLHWLGRHAEQVQVGEAGLALLDKTAVESVEAVLMNQAIL
jgi:predicted ATPase